MNQLNLAIPERYRGCLRVGTCSWKCDSWKGLIYRPDVDYSPNDYLPDYARHLNTVEVDQWFWSLFPSGAKLPDKARDTNEHAARPMSLPCYDNSDRPSDLTNAQTRLVRTVPAGSSVRIRYNNAAANWGLTGGADAQYSATGCYVHSLQVRIARHVVIEKRRRDALSPQDEYTFTMSLNDTDTSLLPPGARRRGTAAFREAVSRAIGKHFEGLGGRATIGVGPDKVEVSWT